MYGRPKGGSAWDTRLHDVATATTEGDRTTKAVQSTVDLTTDASTTSVMTLQSDFNSKIKVANARRVADMEAVKKDLGKIEERMNKRMDGHDEIFTLLHKAQMTMDQNMRMIMSKIGVEPVNDVPAVSLLTQRDRVEE